jgi:hypothetical protein
MKAAGEVVPRARSCRERGRAASEVVPQALPPALTCFLHGLLTLFQGNKGSIVFISGDEHRPNPARYTEL